MTKILRSILSGLLAILLLAGMLPMSAFAASTPFTDVSSADWYADPVLWAVDKGITSGISPTEFGPNNPCTRAQVVTFLWAAEGKPEPASYNNPFTDVANNAWYVKPVLWAVEKGITGGTSPNTFSPDAECTRGQIVTFLYAAAGKPQVSGSSVFTDVSNGDWFATPVIWAKENDITGGTGPDTFGPLNVCTRGQVVTFLYKAYDGTPSQPDITPAITPTITPTPTPTPEVPDTPTLNAEQIYAKCSPAVFYIEISDKNGQPVSSGSGVFLNADGLAITNHHVIDDAYSAKIMTHDGKIYDVSGYYDAKESIDLALLQIDGSGFDYLELGNTDSIAGGQSIFTIGSPQGFSNTISGGFISNPHVEFLGIDSIQISAPISHGSSGGALINDKGQLIGITFAGLDEAQNINFAIPIERMQELSQETLKQLPIGQDGLIDYGASLSFEPTLTVAQGSTESILIYSNAGSYTGEATVWYEHENTPVISAAWAEADNIPGNELIITGNAEGTVNITLYLLTEDDTVLATGTLTVTVIEPVVDYGTSLTLNPTLTIQQGSAKPLLISVDPGSYPYPDEVGLYCEIADESVAIAEWGDWNGWDIPLYVYGQSVGTTPVVVALLDKDDNVLAEKPLTVTVTAPAAPQGQQAFEATRNWLMKNYTDYTNGTYVYSESFELGEGWYVCDLMYTPGDDYIDLAIWLEDTKYATSTFIDLDPNYDIAFVDTEVYEIQGGEYKYIFHGYTEIEKADFNPYSTFRFHEAGYVPPYNSSLEASFMDITKSSSLMALASADLFFSIYLPQYSIADFGYTNIYY